MRVCKESGVDAVIIFPQAGPITEETWINAAKKLNLKIIVGGEMTHAGYLGEESYLKDDTPDRIYQFCRVLTHHRY